MAAIDKIYTTKERRIEFYNWCKENKPDALRYFYDWYDEWDEKPERERPITNFPEEIDQWMMKNCTIKWVVDFIKSQYRIKE